MFPAEMTRHTNCMATAYWAEHDPKSFYDIVPGIEKNQTEEQTQQDLMQGVKLTWASRELIVTRNGGAAPPAAGRT